MSLSVVIPVYNEEKAVRTNFGVIYNTLKELNIDFKVIFVDDGSRDSTWKELRDISKAYNNVTAIRFARNFGKEMAISAGIDCVDSELTLVMDSDLQHHPKHIKNMLELMEKTSCDIVDGIKNNRGNESLKYKICAKTFYKLLNYISGLKMENSTDFKLMNKKVTDSIKKFHESNLFFRGVVDWCGFIKAEYAFDIEERAAGETSFSFFKLVKLSMDAVVSHTSKPLYFTVVSGVFFLVFAVILGIQSLYNYFAGIALNGFSTVILILLFSASLIMISIGIIGIYISRIYDEVKGRPRYLISDYAGKEKI